MGELGVAARAGGHAMVGERTLEALQGRLRGPLLLAGDAGYDEARTVFSALIDHRPALIGCCRRYRRGRVRARAGPACLDETGGHRVAGKAVCDGGLMIAYFHHDLQYGLIILSGWTDPVDNERNIAWTRELFAIWEPHLARAAYVNDLGDEGDDRGRSVYGDNYARLATLKPSTIQPTASASTRISSRWRDRCATSDQGDKR